MRWIRFTLLLLITVAAVQAQVPNTVITGPFGVPRLVCDEDEQWVEPIRVYSDATEIVYIPDITKPRWAQWHVQEFKNQGTYFTYVYTYQRKQRATLRETIYVNTRKQQVLAVPFLKTPVRYNLRTSPPKITRVVAAITQLVQDTIDRFQGPDIQSVARQERYAVGRRFLCNNPQLPPSHDCNLSDEDFQKKHPIYLGSPSPADPKGPSTAVLVYSVEPQYPAEARATKSGGTVTVGMTVDTQGVPQNLQIVKSRGAALDRAALDAVGQYRFKPAHDATGIPVGMRMNVDVDFQIF